MTDRSLRGRNLIHDVVFTVDEKANEEGTKQLGEYFRGVRKRFQVPLDLRGTRFHQDVWRALQEIPYGETRSYKEIAEAISNPKAVRAVGQANGRNPIPIVVPCHRVIRHDGGLGGFGGGLHLKEQLLALEARHR
jgi:O-6-methylguanine DNA methyltransferase